MAPFFLRGKSTSEDGDSSTDLGIGLRYGTFDGVNGIVATASFVYGEANGTETENRLMAGVDYRHNFGDALFGFAKADLHSTVWLKLSAFRILKKWQQLYLPTISAAYQAPAT